jgi:hypothetical protein
LACHSGGHYRILLHNPAPEMALDLLVHGVLLVASATVVVALACALHVVVWRLSPSTPSGLALIALLTGAVLAQCLLAGLLWGSWTTIVVITALALQFAACYVISYPAMQAHSPSLEIARHLAAAGPGGIARAELYARLSEASLVRDRIDDLVNDGLARERDGQLECTARGATLARVFAGWKRLLREPRGG